ncbi:MAG: hypothetical protein GQ476_08010 [Candidatus Aminicenantes bacterium]|jgi:hypothetical protein|nr:hypothetical protein [Candidatus Aminicenantes bacterium]
MKKMISIAAILFLLSGIGYAGDVIFKVKGSYFHPSDKAFKDIYGGGVMYGVEAGAEIRKNLEIWVGGRYFSKKGELSLTREETKLKIIPIEGGLRYTLSLRSANLYGGIGISYYLYKETNPIGNVDWGELGAVARVGSFVEMNQRWTIDFYVSYSYCKMRPADFKINIGGIEAGIGIGYRYFWSRKN